MAITVSAVERDAKRRGFYLIYGDAEEAPVLSVHEDILIRHKLFKGVELDDETLNRIRQEDGRQRAYAAGLAYLGMRPRTRKELERYLARKAFAEADVRAAIERLERERYVDDGEYARAFARQRADAHYKGRRQIGRASCRERV